MAETTNDPSQTQLAQAGNRTIVLDFTVPGEQTVTVAPGDRIEVPVDPQNVQVLRAGGDLLLSVDGPDGEASLVRLDGFVAAAQGDQPPQVIVDGNVIAGDVLLAGADEAAEQVAAAPEDGPVAADDGPTGGGIGNFTGNLQTVLETANDIPTGPDDTFELAALGPPEPVGVNFDELFNPAPGAIDDIVSVDEDNAIVVPVLANDTDNTPDALDVSITTAPANGTAEVLGTGEIRYVPNPDFNGTDSLTYTVTDPGGRIDAATVQVNVNPVNDAPVASDDEATVDEFGDVNINVLANDTDVEGDALTTVGIVRGPANGTANVLSDGSIQYAPEGNFDGTDNLTYQIEDTNGATSTATVEIGVNPVDTTLDEWRSGFEYIEYGTGDPFSDGFSFDDNTQTGLETDEGNQSDVDWARVPDVQQFDDGYDGPAIDLIVTLEAGGKEQVGFAGLGLFNEQRPVDVTATYTFVQSGTLEPVVMDAFSMGFNDVSFGEDVEISSSNGDVILDRAQTRIGSTGEDANGVVTLDLVGKANVTVEDASEFKTTYLSNAGLGFGYNVTSPLELGIVASGDGSDNTLRGNNGPDELSGGAGNDTLIGIGGDDRLVGEEGNDTIFGGDGDDTIGASSPTEPGDDELYGDGGEDEIDGGEGEDVLEGGTGNDELRGGDGADVLRGQDGDDSLGGEAGNDELFGGLGNDTLGGAAGEDELNGGEGNDELNVTNGDKARGGPGSDTFGFHPNQLSDDGSTPGKVLDYNASEGDDIEVSGFTEQFRLSDFTIIDHPDGARASVIKGSDKGSFWVEVDEFAPYFNIRELNFDGELYLSSVKLQIEEDDADGDGQQDDTKITVSQDFQYKQDQDGDGTIEPEEVQTTKQSSTYHVIDAKADEFIEDAEDAVEHTANTAEKMKIFGGFGEDTLEGTDAKEELTGFQGDDTLIGGDGDDILIGGEGDDILVGGAGDDIIALGREPGTTFSGNGEPSTGNDTVVYELGHGSDTIGGFSYDSDGSVDGSASAPIDVLQIGGVSDRNALADEITEIRFTDDGEEGSASGERDLSGGNEFRQADVEIAFNNGDVLTFEDLLPAEDEGSGLNVDLSQVFQDGTVEEEPSGSGNGDITLDAGETLAVTDMSGSDLERAFGDSLEFAPVS